MTTKFTEAQMAAFVEVATKRAKAECCVCDCVKCGPRRQHAIDMATWDHLRALTGGDVVRVNGVWLQSLPPPTGMTFTGFFIEEAAAVPAKTITQADCLIALSGLSDDVKAIMDKFCKYEAESDEDATDSDWIDVADARFKEAFSALRRAIFPSDNY